MTDRELLELAADAIGITLITKTMPNLDDSETEQFFQLFKDGRVGCWNPLTNDGDALRLAVKLGLTIHYPANDCEVGVGNGSCDFYEKHMDSPYSATRRAIVRAAAKIGEDMK